MQRVCEGGEFRQAPRMMAFLQFVVEQTLAGRGEQLKAYTIGMHVHQRDSSFDPNTDPIVRVDARRLRRKLLAYYTDEGAGEAIRIELPKGSYMPKFRRIQEPVNAAPRAITAAASVPVVAVLPFENMSSDPEQEFFCDGISDEIVIELSRYPDVAVVSRHASFQFKGERIDVVDVARRLDARFIVDGSVRRGHDKIRVAVRLHDASDGRQLWAENYTRDLTAQDVIDIQDEVTRSVAVTIAEPYGVIPNLLTENVRHRSSESLSAYEWVLRFYAYFAKPSQERFVELRDHLPTAIQLDSSNASAHAAYSLVCTDATRFFNDQSKEETEWFRLAVALAERAVELDPRSPLAFQALAAAFFHSHDLAAFRKAAENATRLNPNHANLLADLAAFYACLGEWDTAMPMAQRAMALTPHHPNWYHTVPCIHAYLQGDTAAAAREADLQLTPEIYWTTIVRAAIHGNLGNGRQAEESLASLLEQRPDFAVEFEHELRCWNFYEELARLLTTGLTKAGLHVPQAALDKHDKA